MSVPSDVRRFVLDAPASHLRRRKARIQPILARPGTPSVDVGELARVIEGVAVLEPLIAIESPSHWQRVVRGLGDEIDGMIPIGIPALPTEVWNSHPQVLVERGLPFVFWPLMAYDEPDFWRWSASDMLRAIGVPVYLVSNIRQGLTLLKSLATKRWLADSSLLLIGEQNFPWNAHAVGKLLTDSLGIRLIVRALKDVRGLYQEFSDKEVDAVWAQRSGRYVERSVRPDELRQAVRSYLAIRSILQEEGAAGFGVNCFGDLLIDGGRDVPCLAQLLLREDGYIASCDGDFVTMAGMMMATHLTDKPCLMSNMYPLQYVGALTDHFADPLSPDPERFDRSTWRNLARLGHCGFVGVVSPEMTPSGKTVLSDWVGTLEIPRDGRGCGLDGDLLDGERFTAIELCFDGKTLLLADGVFCETTRHEGLGHVESTALLRFRDLPGLIEHISREHVLFIYGDHIEDMKVLAGVLGLTCKVF